MTATASSRLKTQVRDLVAAYRRIATPDEVEAAWGLIDSLALVADTSGSPGLVLQEAAQQLGSRKA